MKHFGQAKQIPGIADQPMVPKGKINLYQKGGRWAATMQRPGVATPPMVSSAERRAIKFALGLRKGR